VSHPDAQQADHHAHAPEHQGHAIAELGRLAASKECEGPHETAQRHLAA